MREVATVMPNAASGEQQRHRREHCPYRRAMPTSPLPPLNPRNTEAIEPRNAASATHARVAGGKSHHARDGDRNRAFEDIAKEGHRGRARSARPRHIGHADIAGADRARIEAAHFSYDDAEGNRSDEVGDSDQYPKVI